MNEMDREDAGPLVEMAVFSIATAAVGLLELDRRSKVWALEAMIEHVWMTRPSGDQEVTASTAASWARRAVEHYLAGP